MIHPILKWVFWCKQIVGQFFNPAFKASQKSWEAALIFHEDAVTTNLPKWFWWQLLGKAKHAKKFLASTVNGDIVAIHGIGVAIHNLVASMHKLQLLMMILLQEKT